MRGFDAMPGHSTEMAVPSLCLCFNQNCLWFILWLKDVLNIVLEPRFADFLVLLYLIWSNALKKCPQPLPSMVCRERGFPRPVEEVGGMNNALVLRINSLDFTYRVGGESKINHVDVRYGRPSRSFFID